MQYVTMAASKLKKQQMNSIAPLIDSTGIIGIMILYLYIHRFVSRLPAGV